ncbi:PLDc N-terminal domain-containing protein [Sinomonas humi]|uniref:Cardiolipin synthase N-terminal domain-containing protein n=1 Tax=Sinomonas humi TaxID=1338436 RepID=A0A0B2AGG9_9MICC|nr:PLDc N-terminal domain-containing protein [Sinomonas humi]KHL01019.1 hypothetical protein LK10_17820 [Sinomonas humi]
MGGVEAAFLVTIFLIWCAILFKVTTSILESWQNSQSKILWIALIWTAPLLGLILWATFGKRKSAG